MTVVVFVIGAVVGMLVLDLVLENREPVTLRYLFVGETRQIPLAAVILVSVGVGFVIAGLFGLAAHLRGRKIIRGQRRTIAAMQTELHALRTLPLEAPARSGGVTAGGSTTTDKATGELSSR